MTKELLALLALFEKSKTPLTARKIADKTGTYPATALRRVEKLKQALRVEGRKLKTAQWREGARGPTSTAWSLE